MIGRGVFVDRSRLLGTFHRNSSQVSEALSTRLAPRVNGVHGSARTQIDCCMFWSAENDAPGIVGGYHRFAFNQERGSSLLIGVTTAPDCSR
jgi:hypothetical protein